MSREARRTLVVDLDLLESSRDLFREMAKAEENTGVEATLLQEQAALINRIIRQGTTVDMDAPKVAGFAKALIGVAEIREDIWQQSERQQFYSEADSTDADWAPAGETA